MKKAALKICAAVMFIFVMYGICCGCTEKYTSMHGFWTGNVYNNPYAGIEFTKPDGWNVHSNEELLKISADVYSEEYDSTLFDEIENFDEFAASHEVTVEMFCSDVETGMSVIISYENLEISGRTDYTAEQYVNHVFGKTENISQEYLDENFNGGWKITTEKLGKFEYECAELDLEESKMKYFVRIIDGYMLMISFGGEGGSDFSELISAFS